MRCRCCSLLLSLVSLRISVSQSPHERHQARLTGAHFLWKNYQLSIINYQFPCCVPALNPREREIVLDNEAGLLAHPRRLPGPSHRCLYPAVTAMAASDNVGKYSSGFCPGFTPGSLFSCRWSGRSRQPPHYHAAKLLLFSVTAK